MQVNNRIVALNEIIVLGVYVEIQFFLTLMYQIFSSIFRASLVNMIKRCGGEC
jgi:hypothetical protein